MKREYETAIRKIIELAKVIENGKNVMWVNGVLDKRLKGRLLTIGKILNQDAGTGDKNCNLYGASKSFVSGSEVKITGCFIGHEFEIGEIVTLVEERGEQWLAENSKGERWYIIPEETSAC